MAMIDYGAWVFKNGKLMNEDQFFMNMEQAVGWTDEGKHPYTREDLAGNYFAYVGDEDLTVAVYKCVAVFVRNKKDRKTVYHVANQKAIHLYNEDLPEGWDLQPIHIHIKNIGDTDCVMEFGYKGDFYRIVYGYGIDPDMEVWDQTKVHYLGKKLAKRLDHYLHRGY